MASGFTPAIREAYKKKRDEAIALVYQKVLALAPDLPAAQTDWTRQHVTEYQDLFQSYLEHGSIEEVRPRMRELTRLTTATGMSLDAFVRVIFDAMSWNKALLVRLMPCSPDELIEAFRLFDAYDYAIFDEFSQAQREYWEKRERQATQLHTDFFNHLPFPAITGTPDLIIREVNPALTECIPVHPEQIIGLSLEQWLLRMSIPPRIVRSVMKRFESQGAVIQEEVEILGAPGQSMWLMLSLNYVHGLEGQRLGFQAMLEDMTEKRRLQRRLADQKAQMDAVFNSTPVGLIYVDSKRVVRRINESACNLLGYPPPEKIEGGNMSEFRDKIKDNYKDPAGFVQLLDEVYSDSRSSRRGMVETVNPPRTMRYSVTPVFEEDGDPIGWLWIFIDMTEQIASEKLKNDLTHMIVHDLKNPLTSIRGGAYLLKSVAAQDARAAQAVDLVQRNCDRMMSMIMNLLDIERLETGKLQLVRAELPLQDFLATTIETQRLAAGEREIALEVPPELTETRISADANLLERVLTNLLSNAIKHTRPEGRIRVTAEREDDARIAISVVDNGNGIPKEYHEKIFQKFGQAELRREGQKTDTGLGLTFCKLAVEAHGGKITVDSEPGKGSAFRITLPIHAGTVSGIRKAAAVSNPA